MLHLKDVPQEEVGEVVRVASEMYDREAQETREHSATKDAAEEIGIPAEYLERAAQEVHLRRVERIQTRRRRNRILAALAAVTVLGGGTVAFLNRPAPPPVTLAVSDATLGVNPQTKASVVSGASGGEQILRVEQFGASADGQFFANLNVPVPQNVSLSQHNAVTFTLRGKGIPRARLFLENGPTERWKSPDLNVSAAPRQVTLPLRNFVHQTRPSSGAPWRDVGTSKPGQARILSFKVGEKINPPNVTGEIAVGGLQFR
jgi:hypothetical protein